MQADTTLQPLNIPRHIAIIMDGNGRWAKERGKDRMYGHHEGAASVRAVVNTCGELGVKYLTLYAFSTENWNRPKHEVDALMELLVDTLKKEFDELHKNDVRLSVIGNFQDLPQRCQSQLSETIYKTRNNQRLHLILALSYSARWEIVEAARQIALAVENGLLKAADVDTACFESYLCTKDIPEPELMIRTSGEYRISNFLLYQIAYSELYFTHTNWPDFRKEHLLEAIADYQQRERRFGKTSEQLQNIQSGNVPTDKA